MFGRGLLAQELPPIINYLPSEYLGGNQNWGISQGPNNFIYVANNEGLLEFNGSKWTLYPLPENAIIRSVSTINGKIYTGSYMDFGYWERNESGQLEYLSLLERLPISKIEDEQFWNILEDNQWVLFQSLDRIIIYNKETEVVNEIEALNSITKVFDTGDIILFQDIGHGLYAIENGTRKLFNDASLLKEQVLVGIVNYNDHLACIFQNAGLFKVEGEELVKMALPKMDDSLSLNFYDAIGLRNGSVVLGSISNGLLILESDGTLTSSIDQFSGLVDNTVLTLFEDVMSNIWVGFDYGLSCINLNNRFKSFTDLAGGLGTIYTSIVHRGRSYLGTNQGLFISSSNSEIGYELVKGTEGQVWSLDLIGDTLFCGHHTGTYIVEGTKVDRISDIQGTWGFKKVPASENLLVQGNYDGLYILEKSADKWRLRNKLKGFKISSKYFEFADHRRLIVSHEYKGVFVLDLDEQLNNVKEFWQNDTVLKSTYSSLVDFDGKLWYGCENGIFQYELKTDRFIRDSLLSSVFVRDQYITGKLISTSPDELWAFSKDHLDLIRKARLGNNYIIEQIPVSLGYRSGLRGYENISKIDDNRYLIGTASGYLILDRQAFNTNDHDILINAVKNGKDEQSLKRISLTGNLELASEFNMITFEYSVPEYNKYLQTEYQYRLKLDGNEPWSQWSTNQSKTYDNLSHGRYQFEVRARIGNNVLESKSYTFSIQRPWYSSTIALAIYMLSGLLLVFLINYQYKIYYRYKQKRAIEQSRQELELKNLAVQKEIVQLKNETLNKDIEARNRELAIATMTMVNKNNLLGKIKEEVVKARDPENVKSVIKLIDSSINNAEDWEFFEKAFNHADKDFFKKVKAMHPSLTSSDLRLCMYLRLNLSSKEIAPLLNITPRSVEIKRYRLRKKLDLSPNQSLNDYFIDL